MSAPAASTPVAPESRAGAGRARTAVVVALGAVLTPAFTYALIRAPRTALVALAVLTLGAGLVLGWPLIRRRPVISVLAIVALLIPPAALLGPVVAVPAFPQVFAFRVLLAVAVFGVLTWLLLARSPARPAAGDLAAPLVLWFGWLVLTLAWSPDKAAGLRYLAVLLTMLLLVAATAAAGTSRRRLQALGVLLVLAYLAIIGVSILETRLGVHLPTSRLNDIVTSQTYAVTSVFHNQNDLATYIALCWPFLLGAFFFTRRPLWLAFTLVLALAGAYAFVRTGSRSSLLAIGLESVAAVALYVPLRGRLTSRTGKAFGAVIVVLLVAAASYLLFNNSENDMLRQFRLEVLLTQVQTQSGSGQIRSSLTEQGLALAGGSLLLGAGPGQAEVVLSEGAGALGITNLHNWWLETYADGGLPGFALHFFFFVVLFLTLWPVARRDPDPLLRYLAGGTVLALIGFTVGALGPSSSISFTPLWLLYGLGIAVATRARLAARERASESERPSPEDGPGSAAPGTMTAGAPGEAR